jgi:hypothetical protein
MSSNGHRSAALATLFLLFALVLASCAPSLLGTETGPRAWVGGPPDGSEVPLGEVSVMCHAYSDDGVAHVELWVNGAFANRAANTTDPGAEYFTESLTFSTTGPGRYVLHCRTYGQGGGSAQSSPVTVSVTGEEPTATTEEPGIPTATPTATEEVPTPTTPPPPPSGTPVPPTATPIPPTSTRVPPTSTPPPPTATPRPIKITSFEVSRSQITAGECVRFNWTLEGSPTEIFFDGEGVTSPDSRDRCPTATKEFELRAEGPGGPVTARVTVVVIQPSPSPEDRTGPSISQVDPTWGTICTGKYCSPGDRYMDIQATVSDVSGVRSVQLYHTLISSSSEQTPQQQLYGSFTRAGGNLWVITYTPPEQFYSGTVEFDIRATDDSPNRNRSWWGPGTITLQPGIG